MGLLFRGGHGRFGGLVALGPLSPKLYFLVASWISAVMGGAHGARGFPKASSAVWGRAEAIGGTSIEIKGCHILWGQVRVMCVAPVHVAMRGSCFCFFDVHEGYAKTLKLQNNSFVYLHLGFGVPYRGTPTRRFQTP